MPRTLYAELTCSKPRRFLRRNRGLLITIAVCALLNGVFYLARGSRAAMDLLTGYITGPFKRGISWLCDLVPFSVAELSWYAAGVFAAVYILRMFVLLFVGRDRLFGLLRRVLIIILVLLIVLLGSNLLLGVNFYGSSFSDKSGIIAEPVSAEDLQRVTHYFVERANELCGRVARDESGHYAVSRGEIFARSDGIYDSIVQEFPFLTAPQRQPKPMLLSRLYSWIGFTGFYFPLTAEINLNVDSPAMMLGSTVAHEMAHQRGIAPEQEANFVSVVACSSSGDPVYGYAGALLAYIHLGNALYKADYDLWYNEYSQLEPLILLDLADYTEYWQQFEGEVSESAGKVYESYLQSYDQELGLKSYGACVDLLVAYYKDKI